MIAINVRHSQGTARLIGSAVHNNQSNLPHRNSFINPRNTQNTRKINQCSSVSSVEDYICPRNTQNTRKISQCPSVSSVEDYLCPQNTLNTQKKSVTSVCSVEKHLEHLRGSAARCARQNQFNHSDYIEHDALPVLLHTCSC